MYKSCEPHRPAIENISRTEMLYWDMSLEQKCYIENISLTEMLYWERYLIEVLKYRSTEVLYWELCLLSLLQKYYIENPFSYIILEIICFIEISNREISSIWPSELAGLASCYTRNTIPRLSLVQTKLFLLGLTGKTELGDLIWD